MLWSDMIRVVFVMATLVLYLGHFAHADGVVDFNNVHNFGVPADRLVRSSDGAPLVGTNYFAQLYYGALGTNQSSLTPVMYPPARFRPPGHSLPGTWAGGIRTLTGFFTGDLVTLQVRVWDGTVAGTYEEAAALNFAGTQYGVSQPFPYLVPQIGGDPDSYIEHFRGFTLVPEPSMALLGVIGIVGLYFWRSALTAKTPRARRGPGSDQ
jgi:hypothetical protein